MRIAIVLSVVWFVGGTLYLDFRQQDSLDWLRADMSQKCRSENNRRGDARQPQQDCDAMEREAERLYSVANGTLRDRSEAPLVAGTFLLLAWFTGGVLFLTLRWIRKGFAAR